LTLSAPAPRPGLDGPISLYVHVPFCATKCPYCDFNTYARIESLVPEYVAALSSELRAWGALLGRPRVATVFYGGGTPSYLPAGALSSIAGAVRDSFAVVTGAEVTAEANPDDCTPERLSAIRAAGVNRLSIGVQSLDDRLLAVLGRRHDSKQAFRSYRSAREAGFTNVSIDLMYGLPGQTTAQWEATVDLAAGLEADHVSMYALAVEPGTPFAADVKEGRLPEPDADLAADMYEHAMESMGALGFRHYEISNWARPGRESRHNLAYWRNDAYLGVGPGAHSHLAGLRFAVVKPPRDYVRRAGALGRQSHARASWPEAVATMRGVGLFESVEEVSPQLEMAESMMMGLRLDTGIDARAFASRFGTTLDAAYRPEIADLTRLGLLVSDLDGIRLTRRGRLLGNEVFERFVLTMQPA
jgi:oxygen-independent coproporphyrinogen-3 oxidase